MASIEAFQALVSGQGQLSNHALASQGQLPTLVAGLWLPQAPASSTTPAASCSSLMLDCIVMQHPPS